MKTTTYNAASEIRFGVLVVVFALAIFTTVKVKELQVKDTFNYEQVKYGSNEIIENGFPVVPVAPAKLIGEPLPENALTNNQNTGNSRELTLQMKSWVNNKAYWSDETLRNEEETAIQMKSWITNRAYWSDETSDSKEEVTLQLQNWITNGTFWSGEADGEEQVIASQLSSWMNNGAYFADATE